MIKILLPAATITCGLCMLLVSCGKHIYMMKGKEINNYAANARETRPRVFVVYENGDTLKGAVLKKHHNVLNGKDAWALDGKDIPLEHIRSYQDEHGYRLGSYSRLLKGKLSFYLYQVDNSRLVTHYRESSKTFVTETSGSTQTTFYMGFTEDIQLITYTSLTQMMKNCQPATKQIDTEFGGGVWKRNPSYGINDYRALIRIINVYNNRCN